MDDTKNEKIVATLSGVLYYPGNRKFNIYVTTKRIIGEYLGTMGFTPISFVVSDSLEKKGIELDRQPDEIAKSSKKNFVWTLDSIKKVSIKKSLTNHFLSRKRGCVIKFSIEGKVLKRMLCCKTEAIQPARDVFRSLELY